MSTSRKYFIVSISFLILVALGAWLTWNGRGKESIKVGFVGCLTGRHSELGISGRDGFMLAVEELNQAGGIHGQAVELIVKDDKHDPEAALKADRELIAEGVLLIIGHMTSSMGRAALPLINEQKIPMISPTITSDEFTGIDDQFIRVTSSNRDETKCLASYAFYSLGLRRIVCVADLSNQAYSQGICENFKAELEGFGGGIVPIEHITSGPNVDFVGLVDRILEHPPDGLLIAAGALDTAMVCQHMRKDGAQFPIMSSAWAMTEDLLQHGGPAVEGVIFSHFFDSESKNEKYRKFKNNFNRCFGRHPDFAASQAYEAALMLFEVLQETRDRSEIKATILRKGQFHGLQGKYEIDGFGDAHRRYFIMTVKGNRFQSVE